MEKRTISRLLKAGLAYEHIAQQLGTSAVKVSRFVKEHLPEQARAEQGRVPAILPTPAFMKRCDVEGVKAVAKDLKLSISAVYRARHRFMKANG
jgi:hypothetical protein